MGRWRTTQITTISAILLACLLLIPLGFSGSSLDAAKTHPIPEICANGLDDDLNGLVDDGCPQTNAFAACTGGYCAEFEDGIFAGTLTTVSDAGASGGEAVQIGTDQADGSGQVKLCGDFPSGTYYQQILAQATTPGAFVWVTSGADVAANAIPLDPENSTAVLRTPIAQYGWQPAATADSNLNFRARIVGTPQQSYALSGQQCLWFSPQPGVLLDAVFLSTDPTAAPTTVLPPASADYTVLSIGANPEPTSCLSNLWTNATVLPFTGLDTGTSFSSAPSVQLLWSPTHQALYGCTTVTDTDLRAPTTSNDVTSVFSEDRVEFNVNTVQNRTARDATTMKFALTPNGAIYCATYPGGVGTLGCTSTITRVLTNTGDLDSVADDTSWRVFFRVLLPGAVVANQVGLGDALIGDLDATHTYRMAFTTTVSFNSPATWGTWLFSGTEVIPGTGPPADTTAPTLASCSTLNIGTTSAQGRCTPTEAGSASVTAKIRYGTTSGGPYPSTTSVVSCASGSACTITIPSLVAATTYYWVMDATDGASNTGTSAQQSFLTTGGTSATVRWISPTGSNGAAGTTEATAWRTWSFALAQLNAGWTLMVADGVYGTSTGTGYPNIQCQSTSTTCNGQPCKNGTPSQPITIQAKNERKPFIKGATGSTRPFFMTQCANWRVIGLRAREVDQTGSSGSSVGTIFAVTKSTNPYFERNLAHHNNRYENGAPFTCQFSTNCTYIENEAYVFHRHGFNFYESVGTRARRNYGHSRDYNDIPGGKVSHGPGGDEGLTLYSGVDSIAENNIMEKSEGIQSSGPRNQLLGNIAIGGPYGLRMVSNCGTDCTSSVPHVVDNVAMDNVSISSSSVGMDNYKAANSVWRRNTIIGASGFGFIGRDPHLIPGFNSSFTVINMLATGGGGYGFHASNSVYSGQRLNSFGHPTGNYSPNSNTWGADRQQVNPNLGTCKIWIPPTATAMKGTGIGGEDIGAGVLYAYENGILNTNKKLWDMSNGGRFAFMGATVCDSDLCTTTPGDSLIGVHTRVGISAACTPVGY